MDMFDKIFDTMKDLGIDIKKLKKYKLISEYCAMLSSIAEATHETLISLGGAIKTGDEELSEGIIFIQKKINGVIEKGNEILNLLK